MAMAYVTSRGKNKKSKESVRKDNKNNQANKLLSAMMKESSKNKSFEQKEYESHLVYLLDFLQVLKINIKWPWLRLNKDYRLRGKKRTKNCFKPMDRVHKKFFCKVNVQIICHISKYLC